MPHSAAAGWTGAALAVLLLSGCSSPQLGDRGGQNEAPPDKISDVDYVEVFRNVDNFPNIARICIEGVAFASTSSGVRGESGVANPALVRVPEWDPKCAGHAKAGQGPAVTSTPTPLG
ncbi:hypothetical protein [Microtetraspora malaysiensis]|uniref:hypothetical protein n=1 Tax=Microtetraspora malaysiensis TaxID=161358 RepID=UPI003D8A997F